MKITKKIFDSEIAMCRKLYKESKGCQWGKCESCGVVPLLYKLYNGLLVENKTDIKKLKKSILSQKNET